MNNINYRTSATSDPSSLAECGQISDRYDSPQNKTRAFSNRARVVALAAVSAVSFIGAVYYLASSQSSVQQLPLSERAGTPICFYSCQCTSGNGTFTPDNNDIYCSYPDQKLPRQMADLVNYGVVRVIEYAENLIYHGARNVFECINQGLPFRQYPRESQCVFMDADICSSLGGHPTNGASLCSPSINPNGSGLVLCTADLQRLCEWHHKSPVPTRGLTFNIALQHLDYEDDG